MPKGKTGTTTTQIEAPDGYTINAGGADAKRSISSAVTGRRRSREALRIC
jgi:hypothetical protein